MPLSKCQLPKSLAGLPDWATCGTGSCQLSLQVAMKRQVSTKTEVKSAKHCCKCARHTQPFFSQIMLFLQFARNFFNLCRIYLLGQWWLHWRATGGGHSSIVSFPAILLWHTSQLDKKGPKKSSRNEFRLCAMGIVNTKLKSVVYKGTEKPKSMSSQQNFEVPDSRTWCGDLRIARSSAKRLNCSEVSAFHKRNSHAKRFLGSKCQPADFCWASWRSYLWNSKLSPQRSRAASCCHTGTAWQLGGEFSNMSFDETGLKLGL